MPGPTPQTPGPRSVRAAAERHRRRTLGVIAGAVMLALVLGGSAWAVVSATGQRDAAPAPRGSASGTQAAGTAVAASSVGTLGAGPTTASPDASEAVAAAASASATRSGPATLTVAAVGDMIFDRRVKALIANRGGTAPLARVAGRLRAADLTIGNLESVLTDGGKRNTRKDATFRGDPRAVEGLAASGFDFLSLANNHVLDYGPDALADTVAFLDKAAIGHAGAGKDKAAAWRPSIVETAGASTAYLAFSSVIPTGFAAQSNRAGLASGWDVAAIEKAIRRAKRTHDYVIVSFHWGIEYKDNASADQIRIAHRSVDSGADMVLAHHPHVIQGLEMYKKRLIAYSLGDFVFDHYSRKTGESFILNADLGPRGVSNVTVTPTYLDSHGRPAVVKGAQAAVILKRLRKISAPLRTTVVINGDTASVKP